MTTEELREENKSLRETIKEKDRLIETMRENNLSIFENLGDALGKLAKLRKLMEG